MLILRMGISSHNSRDQLLLLIQLQRIRMLEVYKAEKKEQVSYLI